MCYKKYRLIKIDFVKGIYDLNRAEVERKTEENRKKGKKKLSFYGRRIRNINCKRENTYITSHFVKKTNRMRFTAYTTQYRRQIVQKKKKDGVYNP